MLNFLKSCLNQSQFIERLYYYCFSIKITSTPKHFELEASGLKKKKQNSLKGTQTTSNKYIKPRLQLATPLKSAAFAAEVKIYRWLKQQVIS